MADEEFLRAESVLRELISEMEKFRSANASLEMASAQAGSLILGIENLCSRAAGLLEAVQKSSPAVARSAEVLTAQAGEMSRQIAGIVGDINRDLSLLKEQSQRAAATHLNQISQAMNALERLENGLIELRSLISRFNEDFRAGLGESLTPLAAGFEDLKISQRETQEQMAALERAQASLQEAIGLMGSRILTRYSKVFGVMIVVVVLQVVSLVVIVLR